jgi:inosine-uridine nucleoside N-ribohydrolase
MPSNVTASITARKIIIDTDPGVDDAMAIFLALRSPEVSVIGLTTIFGNVHTDLATVNALRLLEIAGRSDIPVAHGAGAPLTRAYAGPVPFIHGDDGQGNVHLPPASSQAISQSAAEFMVEQILQAPGEITLVPVGPLTNIALALQLEPRIAGLVHEVVLMGGNALVPGNTSPAAEANIHNDPEAADIVFAAGWSVTMVGLDVTEQTVMNGDHLRTLEQSGNPCAQHLARITPFYQQFTLDSGIDGFYIHDSAAVAYVIDPSLFEVQRWPVRVETQGISVGKTWPETHVGRTHPDWAGRPRVNVCTGVNADRLVALILDRLKH